MLVLISPAKNLDFTSEVSATLKTTANLLSHSEQLMKKLSKLKPIDLGLLMKISPKLADLNFERNQEWQLPFEERKAKQAAFAFNGEVYNGLDISSFTEQEMSYAQDHLRILSGLYGLVRPLDEIMPYRLEMGTKFALSEKDKNLYDFWGSRLTNEVNTLAVEQNVSTLVNLASTEYFKAIKPKELTSKIITPVFKDWKVDKYKVIMMYAKKARGLMASYILKNKIKKEDELKAFDLEGYQYNDQLSDGNDWVFTR
jgi:cytoplasmic iron level regulating protein YaaA (DUF328/UPF0246 family)